MSEKKNAKCAICGREYTMCYSCNKNDPTIMWKLHCDTAEHYKIFQIVNGYTAGIYNKTEAAKRLKNVDLSDFDSLRDNIKTIINDIQRTRRRKKTEDDKPDLASDNQGGV